MKLPKYLAWVRTLPCLHCHIQNHSDPHHTMIEGHGKVGGKAGDIMAVPLCRECHTAFHDDPVGWPQLRWLEITLSKAIADGILIL